jgi:hypothetical protein
MVAAKIPTMTAAEAVALGGSRHQRDRGERDRQRDPGKLKAMPLPRISPARNFQRTVIAQGVFFRAVIQMIVNVNQYGVIWVCQSSVTVARACRTGDLRWRVLAGAAVLVRVG